MRDYTESIFFGLSLRQFIFSILACGVAVGIYFGLKDVLGTETVSWLCVLGAAPFAALGFIKYHGMTSEQFIWAWVKSEYLCPKKLTMNAEDVKPPKKGGKPRGKDIEQAG
ncbi:MAG: PrgI family protein [Oscillospiraceae bacterium]|nr:PrgI family protein [Oscillospiraceae bacterium]